ncbi:MAG: radical SAM protein, partial [Gemmatimonadota bacterium]
VPWYRCFYVYSMGITTELVDLWAREPRLVPYLDMPIQHASDRMLKLMRRPERQQTIRTKVAWLRDAIPDLTIRTTALVGFPTESDAEFRELLEFVDEIQFDRLGAFAYSPQEGTRAALLADDVPDAVKRDRLEQVMELQRAVSADRLGRMVGRETDVLVDEPAALGDPGDLVGRSPFQADDVDGCTYLRSPSDTAPGSFVRARVVETLDYDVIAEPASLGARRSSPAPPRRWPAVRAGPPPPPPASPRCRRSASASWWTGTAARSARPASSAS